MSSDNHVTVVGNCTRDPEMKYSASGVSMANFGIAVSKRWQNKQTQEWEEQTSFFNVQCWRGLADNVASSVTKGTRVVVMGELQQRSWETDAGEKRSVVQITADDVAPSLRFATAEISKISREGAGNVGGGSGASAPRQAAPAQDNEYGEEPF